jgi:signal transduction histidine kinase
MMFGNPNHQPRVLLVEDDAFDLEYVVSILRDDFEVVEATNAQEALTKLISQPFDVVISDSLLPSMSGEQLLLECQNRQPGISLIMLSGVLSLETLLRYINTGNIHACLQKPVDPTSLVNTVHNACRSSRLSRERSMLIGELAEANARIYSERQRLIELNSELRTLLAIATHDLREPLRSTRFFLDRCLDAVEQGEPLSPEYLVRVRHAHDRMDDLLHNLREWLHLQTGEIALRPVNLGQIVVDATDNLSRLLTEHDVMLHCPDDWPDVEGNAPLLRSVVENLISNAVRFTTDGAPKIEFAWQLVSASTVRVSVSDTGIGIDPAYHAQIFGMFKRLESRREFEGTGAGLAICQKIIQRHHGRMGVESTRGDGATFWFELPYTRPASSEGA